MVTQRFRLVRPPDLELAISSLLFGTFATARSPRPLAGFKGPTSKGMNGRKEGRERQERGRVVGDLLLRRGVGEGRKERGREGNPRET